MPPTSDLDALAFLVPLRALARPKVVRVNVTLPADELAIIDSFAEQQGFTRSGFLLRAAREAMVRAA